MNAHSPLWRLLSAHIRASHDLQKAVKGPPLNYLWQLGCLTVMKTNSGELTLSRHSSVYFSASKGLEQLLNAVLPLDFQQFSASVSAQALNDGALSTDTASPTSQLRGALELDFVHVEW